MERKKILWLVSWYPNRIDQFNGDFIQRHARAAALYNDIHVIHLQPDENKMVTSTVHRELMLAEGLTEEIIYYGKTVSFFGRAKSFLDWRRHFKNAIRNHISLNGKPNLVHVHVPMRAGLGALWIKKNYQIPFVVTEHWGIYNRLAPDAFFKRSNWFRYMTKKIFEAASAFLPVSEELGRSVNEWVIRKQYQAIPNVVDTSLFIYRPIRIAEKFRFIHVSSMIPVPKRPADLVDAFGALYKEIPGVELYLVGSGSPELLQYASATGLVNKAIFFTGEISYAAVAEQLSASHVFVLCSEYENQPCAILEALCAGLPVIATNVGGIPELITENNGLLVKPALVQELSEAMKNLLVNYARYDREKISREAKNRFSFMVVGRLFDEVYSNLTNEK